MDASLLRFKAGYSRKAAEESVYSRDPQIQASRAGVPDPVHLIQMTELPPQYAVKFSRVQLMTSVFDSGVLKQRHLKVAGHWPARPGFEWKRGTSKMITS